ATLPDVRTPHAQAQLASAPEQTTHQPSTDPAAAIAAVRDPAEPVVGPQGDAPQQPSGMPTHKYLPFEQQIEVELPDRRWPSRRITRAPRWCAVDLRDGNQALIDPMNSERKLRM